MDAREPRRERRAERLLVLRMSVGVQQADRDGLGVVRGDRVRDRSGIVERRQHALRRHPLRRADAALGRDERRRMRGAQAVQVGTGLAAELDEVLEARRGHEDGPRRRALQQRVRRHGGPVREGGHLLGRGARALQHGAHRGEHALGLVVRRGGGLGRDEPPVRGDHGIGEGASDVDPEEHAPDHTQKRVSPARRSLRPAVPPACLSIGRLAPSATVVRPPARPLPSPPGAGATGSSRCAAAACAGTACPCGWWRGTPACAR